MQQMWRGVRPSYNNCQHRERSPDKIPMKVLFHNNHYTLSGKQNSQEIKVKYSNASLIR